MRVLIKVATAPSLDDPAVLDPLISTDSWQTIITFARESARASLILEPPPKSPFLTFFPFSSAASLAASAFRYLFAPHGRRYSTRALRSDSRCRRSRWARWHWGQRGCWHVCCGRIQSVPALYVRKLTWGIRLRGLWVAVVSGCRDVEGLC